LAKTGLIAVIIILSIIAIFFYLPYIEFLSPEHRFRHDNQLIDHFNQSNYYINLSLLTLFFPIMLVIESTFWISPRNNWNKIILIMQSALIIWGGFIIWFIMSFNIFSGKYILKIPFYLILIYLSLGAIWNVLLVIPFFNKHKLISGTFEKLSLLKPKEYIL